MAVHEMCLEAVYIGIVKVWSAGSLSMLFLGWHGRPQGEGGSVWLVLRFNVLIGGEGLVRKRLDIQQRYMISTTAIVNLDMDTTTCV